MEYKAKTIHFKLPMIARPFLFSDPTATLLTTCVRQLGCNEPTCLVIKLKDGDSGLARAILKKI